MSNVTRKHKGFTLIELIIGITLLVIGTVSVFSLAVFSIHLNRENVMKVQALELAREGIEAIRNMRDSNWENNYPAFGGDVLWGASIDTHETVIVEPTFGDAAPWKVQQIDIIEGQRDPYRLNVLHKGESTIYVHESGDPSPFYRYVEITPLDEQLQPTETATQRIQVVCHVSWLSGEKEQSVQTATILTDWKKI